MANTVKDLIGKVEHAFGRQSHKYLMNIMNDGLSEIAQTARANTTSAGVQVVTGKRWYELDARLMIDVYKVDILDDQGSLRSIKRLTGNPEIGDDT